MRYSPSFEEKLRTQIRNQMVITPLITVMAIKEKLEIKLPLEYTKNRFREELARTIHYERLPPEVRIAVIAAWTRRSLLPKAAIEQMVSAANLETAIQRWRIAEGI